MPATTDSAVLEIGAGPTVIGFLNEVEIEEERTVQELEVITQAENIAIGGALSTTISATAWFDKDDAGQAAVLLDGSPVTIAFYPQGKTVGLPRRTGSWIISGRTERFPKSGYQVTFTATADGAIDRSNHS